uniref:Uncharacterized protein AlNc14C21G2169 n=1 Tax=Albugo laibachii Nc14 TaxID=890382 RepID=F0W5K4_9STRA|nr:conserved hypothetical protein [Albugo laibachii Nc14]|eukprot:CCA16395.1 conserved hypothetical protein [Albugo laibachii Nc14]
MVQVNTLASFLVIGALWGCTNPLMKKGSVSNVYTRENNSVRECVRFIVAFLTNWKFTVPFLVNQSGSMVYVYLLGSTELSNAVPICNSLSFVFTAITATLLGEKSKQPACTYAGMLLVCIGVLICYNSK